MLLVLGVRLAQGPINVDAMRSIIVSRLEDKLPHTHASIKHLDLVWFGDARAVGFRFQDLMIRDSHNRIIARAGKMETALAADSLLLMHLAPARLTAEDFFVAASVSKQGKYDLGFDAHGAPGGASDMGRYFADLVGPEKLGRPISFAREVSLKNGELRLSQEGAPLDWTAKVATIDFSKLRRKVEAHIDLAITPAGGASAGSTATLKAHANAAVGLKTAFINANVGQLNPARVFPSVGPTRFLAMLDAPVDGLARIDYALGPGFQGAWLDLNAGAGHISIGGRRQDFNEARIKATYASAKHTAVFQTFRVKSHLIDTDLSGTVRLEAPDEKTKRDFTVRYDFSGPRVTGRLADDFAEQTLTQAHFRGAYVPDRHRLIIDSGSGKMNGAALQTQGLLYTNDKGQLGADLTATLKGDFSKSEIFAFWPEDMAPNTRHSLIERIVAGDFSNADFVLKAPPGHFAKDQMQDADLRLDFDYRAAEIAIEDRMKHATQLQGHGILLGNSFSMVANTGQLGEVALDHGTIDIADFHNPNTHIKIVIDAHGEVVAVVEAVDPLADGQLSKHGLTRERLSGTAQGHVDIDIPTMGPVNERTMGLVFTGHVQQGGFKQAALGWDLTDGEVTVTGDMHADKLDVTGPGKLGPYTGDIGYHTQFNPKSQAIDFKGSFNAAQFGGSPKVPVPITGQMTMAHGKGQGTVTADIFKGTVTWTGDDTSQGAGDDRPSQIVIDGFTLRDGMEAQGLPIFEHLKAELPTRISLLRSGDIWSGEIDAESLSGDIAYVQGTHPRLVYQSTITPDEAREIGYGALPMFNVPRHLTVNISLDGASKEALLKLDKMNAVLGWSEIPGSDEVARRLDMTVQPDDWTTLGLPAQFFHATRPVPVTVLWSQTDRLLSGTMQLLDQTIAFDMPIHPFTHGIAEPPPMVVPGKVMPYTLQVRGDVSPDILSVLGYTNDPVRVAGPVGLVFSLYDLPGQPAAVLSLDASRAEMGVKATDWKKPEGETAQFAVSFDDSSGAPGTDVTVAHGLNLSSITGNGDRIRINGRASFAPGGDLEFADFSNLYLKDFIDVNFKFYAVKDQASNVIAISGQQLDLRPWLDASNGKGGKPDAVTSAVKATETQAAQAEAGQTQPTHLVVDLANLQTSPEGAFRQIKLDVNWDGKSGIQGQGSGLSIDGSPMTLALKSQGTYSLFSLDTGDLGDVIRTFSGVPNVKGGDATIAGVYQDGQVDASVKGEDIRVKQIPLLGQLLTVASLQGLNDTLVGDGILFSDFDFPVRYKGHELFIRNGYAKGEALGINVWGTTDLDAKTMNFNGTLIPAYSINALFGDVKSKGLGLIGLKYNLKGTYKTPLVDVNPLSLVLPGFIKAAFDSERKDAIPPLDLPNYKDMLDDMRPEKPKKSKK